MDRVVVDGWTLSPEVVGWGAEQTIRMHEEQPSVDRPNAGRCNRCPQVGECEALVMARAIVAAFAAAAR